MSGPSTVTRSSGSAALALVAFVLALFVAWAHPVEASDAHERHECDAAAHVDRDGDHHDAATCALCDLAHAPALAPVPDHAPALQAQEREGELPLPTTVPALLRAGFDFDSRGPPAR